MKYFSLLTVIIIFCACQSVDNDLLLLDPHQPGLEPEVFAEGIISTEESVEFSICFAPDLSEILFSRRSPDEPNQIMSIKKTSEGWANPEPFKYAFNCFEFEPYISPDNRYLLYGSKRPVPGSDSLSWFPDIWICEKNDTGWTAPRHYRTGMM